MQCQTPLRSLRSLPTRTEGGLQRTSVVQVLSVNQRLLTIRGLPDSPEEEPGLFDISAQPLQIWRGPDDGQELPAQLEVFLFQEPEDIDVLLVTGADPECRAAFRKWTAARRGHRFSRIAFRWIPDVLRPVARGAFLAKIMPLRSPRLGASPRCLVLS